MQTKFDEIVSTTSIIEEMKGKFLGKTLLRSWNEDFIDEDTGQVVQIERHERLFDKGTVLDNNALSQINFMLQSGDIKEVVISNQMRACSLCVNHSSVWQVSIELNGKKRNIYLYANSINSATEIAVDFVEQKYHGMFKIHSVKELDYSNLLNVENEENENSEDINYYKIEAEIINHDGETYNQNYILKASDVDNAKTLIVLYITQSRNKANDTEPFEVIIISAKKIPCNDVIDYEFSKVHLENNAK